MYELACLLDENNALFEHFPNLRKAFLTPIYNYYKSSFFENSNLNINLKIDRLLRFYDTNKDYLRLSLKSRLFFEIPLQCVKKGLIKLYFKIRSRYKIS